MAEAVHGSTQVLNLHHSGTHRSLQTSIRRLTNSLNGTSKTHLRHEINLERLEHFTPSASVTLNKNITITFPLGSIVEVQTTTVW